MPQADGPAIAQRASPASSSAPLLYQNRYLVDAGRDTAGGREGEHAAKAADSFKIPGSTRLDENLGIGGGEKAVTERPKLFAELDVVIDLALSKLARPRPARALALRSLPAGLGRRPLPSPRRTDPLGQPTPRCDLGLKPGDLVRVKPYQEILATLDITNSNRGLAFDAELVPYCGKIYRVKTRVDKFIDEKTGKMRHLRTPAVMLEGVTCKSRYCGQRMFCPRSLHS